MCFPKVLFVNEYKIEIVDQILQRHLHKQAIKKLFSQVIKPTNHTELLHIGVNRAAEWHHS